MAAHNELGSDGEELAVKWLAENGYEILHRNWRYRKYEIDIIARKSKFLHFVEVKTRKSTRYGFPEENVRKKKFRNLQRAADEYLHQHPGNRWIEFNILSIILHWNKDPEFFLVKDLFL